MVKTNFFFFCPVTVRVDSQGSDRYPLTTFYAPNFEKVGRAYCFRLVCLSVCLSVCVCVCACVRLLTFEW